MSMNRSGSGHSVGDAEMVEATGEDQELALGKLFSSFEFYLLCCFIFFFLSFCYWF